MRNHFFYLIQYHHPLAVPPSFPLHFSDGYSNVQVAPVFKIYRRINLKGQLAYLLLGKKKQLQCTFFLPPSRLLTWGFIQLLFRHILISVFQSSLLPSGSHSAPSFFMPQCNEGHPWRMQASETRLCCQLSLMLCSMLMEEDVLCAFLPPYPWENWALNWDSSSFWSQTAENRPLLGSSSFFTSHWWSARQMVLEQ